MPNKLRRGLIPALSQKCPAGHGNIRNVYLWGLGFRVGLLGRNLKLDMCVCLCAEVLLRTELVECLVLAVMSDGAFTSSHALEVRLHTRSQLQTRTRCGVLRYLPKHSQATQKLSKNHHVVVAQTTSPP